MQEKKKISARDFLADIKAGMTDEQLTKKYGLLGNSLERAKDKLVTTGLITRSELDVRRRRVQADPKPGMNAFVRRIGEWARAGLGDGLGSLFSSSSKAGHAVPPVKGAAAKSMVPASQAGQGSAHMRGAMMDRRPREFLAGLSKEEKIEASKFSPFIYRAVKQEKEGGEEYRSAGTLSSQGMALLRKLSADDLEALAESASHSQKADETNDPARCVDLYKQCLATNPFNDIAMMSLGVCLAQIGRPSEGVKWLEKALELNPGNDRIRMNLQAVKQAM